MKILPFRAAYPNLEKTQPTNAYFDAVKFKYQDFVAEHLFNRNNIDAIYLYRLTTPDGLRATGVIATVDLAEYENGRIKKHEKTIVKNEDLQGVLLEERKAAIKPVLLAHPSVSALKKLIDSSLEVSKKFYVIEIEGEKHCFWQISDPESIAAYQSVFDQKIPLAYIADGHHRSASFAALHKKIQSESTSKLLCAFFDWQELQIKAFHRVVSDLNGMTPDAFLGHLTQFFKIKVLKKGVKPYAKFEMTMFLDGKWFQLNWRKSALKDFPSDIILLDVHLLNEKILKTFLGIHNVRADKRLRYAEDTDSINDLEKACPTEGVVFCLFPVEAEDLQAVADADGTMPPKSTFFLPRMKNGLLVYEY